jgi:hypothetical protein
MNNDLFAWLHDRRNPIAIGVSITAGTIALLLWLALDDLVLRMMP